MAMAALEAGTYVEVNGIKTFYHHAGSGKPVVLIHGSGPGVSAWANWRLVLPELSRYFAAYALDVIGFGKTDKPADCAFTHDDRVNHVINFIETLRLAPVYLIGNSMGGALALAIADRRPDVVTRMVLMGSVGVSFPITEGLAEVWGYTPSLEKMRRLIDLFAFNKALVTDELARLRYESSIQPGYQEAYAKAFPPPLQQHIETMSIPEDRIRRIQTPALCIHGREDRIIPLEVGLRIYRLLPHADMHIFGECGHWTQIEKTADFNALVIRFFQS
jgi:2-hydroxymuconate-semialdehyde hydrolase